MCRNYGVLSSSSEENRQRPRGPVAGIGGLGHLAVKMAAAMGATVVEITQSEWKVKDAARLGANEVCFMPTDQKKYEGTLDLIIDTVPQPHDLTPLLVYSR